VFRREYSELNVQLVVTSGIKNGKFIFEMELDIGCFRTDCSEVNVQFEVKRSIRNGIIVLEMDLDIECL